jgi:hypothetical protein
MGSALLGQPVMVKLVPILVAAMVLTIRVLLINTFSIAGERIFTFADSRAPRYQSRPAYRPQTEALPTPREMPAFPRPAPKPTPAATRPLYAEPTYHPVGMSARERSDTPSMRS